LGKYNNAMYTLYYNYIVLNFVNDISMYKKTESLGMIQQTTMYFSNLKN
jgi:hypothetical protein